MLGDVGADQVVETCAGGLVLLALGEVGLLLFCHCGAVLALLDFGVLDEQVQPTVFCHNPGVFFFNISYQFIRTPLFLTQ